MAFYSNFEIACKTTLGIGGTVEVYSVPETRGELLSEVRECRKLNVRARVIGKGSNLLITDKKVRGHVISLERCENQIEFLGGGEVRVGAGVPLSKFIVSCINNDLYGNEYLSSVPGTIGGAVFMNAGTWVDRNLFISDYLTAVEVFEGDCLRTMTRDECKFGYRKSVFHSKSDLIILSATFKLPSQPKEVGVASRRRQLAWARSHQDVRYGNAGSIFKVCNGHVLGLLQGRRIKNAGWSPKTGNWINNYGGASYRNILALIWLGELLHKVVLKPVEREVVIWDD